MKILAILNGKSGKSYHRLYGPLRDLQIRDFADVHVHYIMDKDGRYNSIPDIQGYDLLVWSESLWEIQAPIMEQIERYGIPFIVDIDDHWRPNRYNPAYHEWEARGLPKKIEECIFKADAVIVENERVGSIVNVFNRNWHIVQNALDFTAMQWNFAKQPDSKFRLGFVGGRSHRYDLLMIADALRAFGESGGVEVRLCGYQKDDPEWMAVARGLFQDEQPEWLKFLSALQPWDYGAFYSELDCAIAPLISNNFNAMKSDIKVKEAGAYSLPLIASDFGPYRNHESAGVYTAKNNREWLALLNRAKAGELDGRPNAEYLQDAGCLQHVNLRRVEIYSAVIQSVTR